jgi:hypothetical protein
MVHPGSVFNVTVFVADTMGEPASDLPVCLRFFAFDWEDLMADEVLVLDHAAVMERERENLQGDTSD